VPDWLFTILLDSCPPDDPIDIAVGADAVTDPLGRDGQLVGWLVDAAGRLEPCDEGAQGRVGAFKSEDTGDVVASFGVAEGRIGERVAVVLGDLDAACL
jgi:hypothetical protein